MHEPLLTGSLPQLAPLAPLPPPKSGVYQCPNCNRNLANARNLQRHRQTCGSAQHAAPQLAAMLQRSPPPCASAPPVAPPTAPSTSFQHHNSTGNLTLSYSSSSSRHQSSLYSPQLEHQDLVGNPNVMLSDGYEYKDDPMLYQGPSGLSDSIWSRDDSFHSEPPSASHDQLDMDHLGFPDPLQDPLHHLDSFDSADHRKETPRECHEPDELMTLDPTPPQCGSERFYGINIDDMPLSLDCDEPLMRSESASLSSSSQGRNTPAAVFTWVVIENLGFFY